jgi:hypothetical protein
MSLLLGLSFLIDGVGMIVAATRVGADQVSAYCPMAASMCCWVW